MTPDPLARALRALTRATSIADALDRLAAVLVPSLGDWVVADVLEPPDLVTRVVARDAAGPLQLPRDMGAVGARRSSAVARGVLYALDEDGGGKGSGRSISGVDLGAAVLAAKDSGLLVAGGGHAMAAGLTIAADQIPKLADFLEERLADAVDVARGDRALLVDAVLAPGGVNPALIESMEVGGPYGMGWPAPRIAAGPFRVRRGSPSAAPEEEERHG